MMMKYKYHKPSHFNLSPSFSIVALAIFIAAILLFDITIIVLGAIGKNQFTLIIIILHYSMFKFLPQMLLQGYDTEIEIAEDCQTISFKSDLYHFSSPISDIKRTETRFGNHYIYYRLAPLSFSPFLIIVNDGLEHFQQFQEELARCRDQARKNP